MTQSNATIHPRRSEVIDLAAAEGHDADIPSNLGYIHQFPTEPSTGPNMRLDVKETSVLAREKDVEKASSPESIANTDIQDEETELDPNIVDFNGPDDPANPMNWPFAKKWGMVFLISAITFLTPLASSIFAPGIPEVMRDFGSTNDMLRGFMLSVYVLGFAFGPLSKRASLFAITQDRKMTDLDSHRPII
jgi:hypothetical protein